MTNADAAGQLHGYVTCLGQLQQAFELAVPGPARVASFLRQATHAKADCKCSTKRRAFAPQPTSELTPSHPLGSIRKRGEATNCSQINARRVSHSGRNWSRSSSRHGHCATSILGSVRRSSQESALKVFSKNGPNRYQIDKRLTIFGRKRLFRVRFGHYRRMVA
jgi:hypothetical protein